jgi:heat shock protein HslJ
MKNSFYLALITMFTACLLTACSTTKTNQINASDLVGNWVIESIEQQPVIDHSPARLVFNDTNRVSGSSSCNRIMTSYVLTPTEQGSSLTFNQSAGTMMMCPEVLMNQEKRFLAALPKVAQVKIENGLLILTDENNQLIFKASKQEEK